MDTIDFCQLVSDLKVKMSHREILQKAELKKLNPELLQQAFEDMQNLLDLHLEVCPETHNSETLMVSR